MWLVALLGGLSVILVIGLADPIKWLGLIFCNDFGFCDVVADDYGVEISNGLAPFAFLPWIFLGGVVLSPLAWRMRYLRDEKLHNELLKLSYKRKAELQDRWKSLTDDKQQADMAIRLMEHWMEKGPEEAILALINKKDSNSPPLTLAALAAAIAAAASRRVDK